MDRAQFLALLGDLTRRSQVEWDYVDTRRSRRRPIRTNTWHRMCPITFVANKMTGKQFRIAEYAVAAKAINLDEALVTPIVLAADDTGAGPIHQKLRRELLKACRISDGG